MIITVTDFYQGLIVIIITTVVIIIFMIVTNILILKNQVARVNSLKFYDSRAGLKACLQKPHIIHCFQNV